MDEDLAPQLRLYFLFRSLAQGSEYRVGRAVAVFAIYLERAASLSDLDDERVSEWIRWLQSRYAPKSVVGFRGDLLSVWRDCAGRGLCTPPNRVRRVKKPEPLPIAWTNQEKSRLVTRTRSLRGTFPNGVSRAEYCEALVLAINDTGLRRSDIWRLRREQVRADGSIPMRQHKTSFTHEPRMRPETAAKFLRLPGDPPLACPYASPSGFYKFWKTVTAGAEIRHGALQQMRRTGATHLAITHRESVQRYLGHRTAEMARHYIDESIAQPQHFLPPPMEDL